MAGASQRFSWPAVGQALVASVVCLLLTGIWTESNKSTQQLADLNAAVGTVRRDLDRHESVLQQYSYTLAELKAEQRRETQRQY